MAWSLEPLRRITRKIPRDVKDAAVLIPAMTVPAAILATPFVIDNYVQKIKDPTELIIVHSKKSSNNNPGGLNIVEQNGRMIVSVPRDKDKR